MPMPTTSFSVDEATSAHMRAADCVTRHRPADMPGHYFIHFILHARGTA